MVAIFLTRLFFPHVGGVEKHVYNISRELIEKGHSVTVITEKYEEGLKLYERLDGIEIYRIPVKDGWFKKFTIWWWLFQNKNIIKRADIVHCHDVFFWYIPFRFLFPIKRVFVTFHGYETKFPISRKAILIRKLSEKLSMGNICIGGFIEKWYGTRANYVIYGGIDEIKSLKLKVSKALFRASSKIRSYNSKLKILFIGRLEEDNGVRIYLEALRILRGRGFRFEFEACGDGSLRADVEQFGKVHGFVKDVAEHMKKADIIFASSYLSILEALAFNKRVIAAYDNDLKKDYLEMSPFAKWIVIETEPEKIIGRIMKQQDRSGLKTQEEAMMWARQQTWDKVASLYEKLWNLC